MQEAIYKINVERGNREKETEDEQETTREEVEKVIHNVESRRGRRQHSTKNDQKTRNKKNGGEEGRIKNTA